MQESWHDISQKYFRMMRGVEKTLALAARLILT
jgi:hypothetical protein